MPAHEYPYNSLIPFSMRLRSASIALKMTIITTEILLELCLHLDGQCASTLQSTSGRRRSRLSSEVEFDLFCEAISGCFAEACGKSIVETLRLAGRG